MTTNELNEILINHEHWIKKKGYRGLGEFESGLEWHKVMVCKPARCRFKICKFKVCGLK